MRKSRSIWILTAVVIVVRIAFMVFHRVDSDEPQHLHVAWAWSRGLIQYRDVFDNHFPLLHLLFAPFMRVMPESSAVFLLARVAIAPLAIGCAWLVYAVGRTMIDSHLAAIAALTFSVLPPWLPKSVEFRNDTLWIFFWLATLAFVIRKRPLLAGVAAALCLLASVKALPLLLAHALALASQRSLAPKFLTRMAAGAAIPLVTAAAFLFVVGALDEMLYATLFFNVSLPVEAGRRIGGMVAFATVAPALVWRGPGVARIANPFARHLALFAVWYLVVLLCFWPLLTPRDFLPLTPLAALALAATRVTPSILIVAAALLSAGSARIWRPAEPTRHHFVDAATRLTSPYEFVFDLKGDAIFRRRPVYYIYDAVGRALTNNGTLPDLAPEQIIARQCCVAIGDVTHLPSRTRAFLNQHFLDVGPLRVCGTVVRNGAFTIAVPQIYDVVARDPSGLVIDGVPYRGPRILGTGRHTLMSPDDEEVTVIWWRAAKGRV